jgi:ATP-dependent RNA helicase DHX29
MTTIATPNKDQSKAYIATVALFAVFGSTKEEKVFMRLPPTWKDLWTELAEARKNQLDAEDRTVVKALRALVRQRLDQEEEEGVVIQSAFKGRGANRNGNGYNDQASLDRVHGHSISPEFYQRIWFEKANSPRFRHMLVSAHRKSVELDVKLT